MENDELEGLYNDINALNIALVRDLENDITKNFNRVALFYRIFTRIKSAESTIKKFQVKNYGINKKMQDLIGVRIVVYFLDDIDICIELLKNTFELIDETIDKPDSSTFKPTRVNLIFKIPEYQRVLMKSVFDKYPIDSTFEVQIRTVFSEGWHEVEHDLRYKCPEDWNEYPDLERMLNGIVATLETCDFSMLMLFEELAYRHYQNKNWIPMLKNKYRIRISTTEINENLKDYFENNHEIMKKFLKFDRKHFLLKIIENNIKIPININNLIFITNLLFIHDEYITQITPKTIMDLI